MSPRFAGSRMLDERRRRRLASELVHTPDCGFSTEDCGLGDVSTVSIRSNPDIQISKPEFPALPLRKIVSPTIWKHCVLASVVLCTCLLLDTAAGRVDGSLPGTSDLREFLRRLVTCASVVLLFVTSQFALLIGWLRSRSPQDFDGRYRAWYWCGALLLVSAMGVGIGLDGPAALRLLRSAGVLTSPLPAWALWSPVTAVCGLTAWHCWRDMARCTSSRILLAISLPQLFAVQFERVLVPGITGFNTILPSLGVLLLSFYLHARFVSFVCCDPPVPSHRLRDLIRRFRGRLPRGSDPVLVVVDPVDRSSETADVDELSPEPGSDSNATDNTRDQSPNASSEACAGNTAASSASSGRRRDSRPNSRTGRRKLKTKRRRRAS